MEPYIGITDFTSCEQVQDMLAVFRRYLPKGSSRKLHVGVMMSHKTLYGLPTKWTAAFPLKESIGSIFCSDDTYNCLHYADYDHDPKLWESLTTAIGFGGIGIHALQLDMIWPEPEQIANAIHASRKELEVILQIGKNALDAVQNSPKAVIEQLADYNGVIQRVLLDKSMGRGLGMDAAGLMPFIQMIRNNFPDLGIGVAGGLGPNTMHLVEPIAKAFPNVSIDAQGRLRPSSNALDPIDWGMASEYIRKALAILR